LLIELSGIDGSGKSTIAAAVRDHLDAAGLACHELVLRSAYKRVLDRVARARGGADWRRLFSPDEAETAQALEMLTHVLTVLAPLDLGRRVVLTDTYVARWLATAVVNGVADPDRLAALYRLLPAPDLSFHLALPPELAVRRIQDRPKGDKVLGPGAVDTLSRYRTAFGTIEAVLPYTWIRVDATRSVASTVAEILAAVEPLLARAMKGCP
jgi:thymidylate kinase